MKKFSKSDENWSNAGWGGGRKRPPNELVTLLKILSPFFSTHTILSHLQSAPVTEGPQVPVGPTMFLSAT